MSYPLCDHGWVSKGEKVMNVKAMLDYAMVAQEKEHELKLLIKLNAPEGKALKRKPLNLAVVVDRSGSMSGEKLECTKAALKTLITHLAPEDVLTVVTFDDAVEVVWPPQAVTNKDELKHAVDRIHSGGSTNLSGGWLKGLELLARTAERGRLSRCLLLTDGEANVGIVAKPDLVALGLSARQQKNIVTTTLGFGEGFNEDLLTSIARESGGAFYYVDNAEHAPSIFNEELQGLLKLTAQNITLSCRPAAPVKLITQWTDYPAQQNPDSLVLNLGDAYSGETKCVLLGLWIPCLKSLGPVAVAEFEITYAEIADEQVSVKHISQIVHVNVADGETAADGTPDVEVLQQFGLQLAAKSRKQAMQEADNGDFKKAKNILQATAVKLRELPDTDTSQLNAEANDMEEQARGITDREYATTRKTMAEASYNLSTSQYSRVENTRLRKNPRPSQPTSKDGTGT